MKIDQVLELDEGKVQFRGTLDKEQTQLVLQVGLSVLLQTGAMPYITDEFDPTIIMPDNDLVQ